MMEKLFRNMTPWSTPQAPRSVAGDRRQHPIRPEKVQLKALWGRRGATGMTNLYNNLDVDLPVWGGPGLKAAKLPFFRKNSDSSSGTSPEVFSLQIL